MIRYISIILSILILPILSITIRIFVIQPKNETHAQLSQFLSEEELKKITSSICVQIFYRAREIGSGTLIGKKGGNYLVLTNAHVVRGVDSISIKTPDGKNHAAEVLKKPRFDQRDIALLRFNSDNSYQIASLEETTSIREGYEVLAAGFTPEKGLILSTGKISLIPDKILKEGYQIGYTSEVEQGMSGGPILNAASGKLIGINGKSAFPITDNGYVYEDGSTPSADLIEKMRASSWGIPVQNFIDVMAQENWETSDKMNLAKALHFKEE